MKDTENGNFAGAFFTGFSGFIRKFWFRAANESFTTMLLIVGLLGSLGWIHRETNDRDSEKAEWKREASEIRNECRREMQTMNDRIDTLLIGLNDCNQARRAAEAQNAVLLQLLKRKR